VAIVTSTLIGAAPATAAKLGRERAVGVSAEVCDADAEHRR
jgi:hypothetical protein